MFSELQAFIKQNDLENEVELVGKKTTNELRELYRQSDFVVQAPKFEGFGKVPIEGFFHGVVPVLNNVGLASNMTGNEERGFLFDAADPANLADKLIEIKEKIFSLPAIIERGRGFAKEQTLERWANEYYATVSEFYKYIVTCFVPERLEVKYMLAFTAGIVLGFKFLPIGLVAGGYLLLLGACFFQCIKNQLPVSLRFCHMQCMRKFLSGVVQRGFRIYLCST